MTLPPSYSWYPKGERLEIPFEAPQGRRVNGIGLLISHGPEAGRLDFDLRAKLPKDRSKTPRSLEEQALKHGVCPEDVGPIDAAFTLAFLWQSAGRPANAPAGWRRERALIIYLDNYSVHTSKEVKAARSELAAANVFLVYLPSYSPELSDIEPVWNDVKYHRMTRRSFDCLGDLMSALAQTLTQKALDLLLQHGSANLCVGTT